MIDFRWIAGVVMDMDGVLWRGDQPLPGLTDMIAHLRRLEIPFALATNNSRLSPADYQVKLAGFGIHGVETHQIVTSGTATVSYVQRHYPAGSLIHVLGGDGLRTVLSEAGYVVTGEYSPNAAAVAVGLDKHLTYEKLKNASLTIRAGAAFIATNRDATYPDPEGLIPGSGSIVSALETSSGVTPINIGKPDAPMFEAALLATGTLPANTLMIGDRLDTDIAGAAALGFKTALVLTGVSSRLEAESTLPPPDAIFDGLPALIAAWQAST